MFDLLPRLSSWDPLPLLVVLAVAGLVAVLTVWSYCGLFRAIRLGLWLGIAAAVGYVLSKLVTSLVARDWQLSAWSEVVREQIWNVTGSIFVIVGLLAALRLIANCQDSRAVRARPHQVAILLALRLLALGVVFLVLLRPTWQFSWRETLQGVVIILLDESRSMQERDEPPQMSRWEKATQELEQAKPVIEELARQGAVEPVVYGFHSLGRLRVLAPDQFPKASDKPEGPNSAILDAIVRTIQEHDQLEKRVFSVIVLSDGRDTLQFPRLDEVVQRARERSVRIHAVAFGHPGGTALLPDVELALIEAPRHVRIKDRLVVTGVVKTQQLVNEPITIRLFIDGKPAPLADKPGEEATVTITPQRSGQTFRLTLPAVKTPDQPGNIRVALRADPKPNERDLSNNEKVTTITVTKAGMSVLYIDRLRAWEPREITRALKSDERISLYTDFDYRLTDPNEWQAKLLHNLKNNRYDVFILGDIPASQFNDEILWHLANQVEQHGSGLLMIGGHNSFAAGGWHRTRLARILPVDMSEAGSLEGGPGHVVEVPFIPDLRALAEHHFILRQGSDPKTSQERWRQLPPLSGGSKVGRPVVRAQVLATNQPNGKGDILLAVLDGIGKGRSAALAVDTTWRWTMPRWEPDAVLKPLPPGQLTDGQAAFIRFWRQLLLWLAHQDLQGDAIYADLELLDLPRGSTQTVLLQAVRVQPGGAQDERQPVEGAIFRLELQKPNQPQPQRLQVTARSGADGKAKIAIPREETLEPGQYVVYVSAELNGKAFGERLALSFQVTDINREDLNRSPNYELLGQLCLRTGGLFLPHSGLSKILEMYRSGESTSRQITYSFPEWEKPMPLAQGLALLLFALFITAEWTLRRLWGLV